MLVTSLCIQTSFGEGFPFGIKKVTTLKRMNNAKNSRYRVPKKSVAFNAGTKKIQDQYSSQVPLCLIQSLKSFCSYIIRNIEN